MVKKVGNVVQSIFLEKNIFRLGKMCIFAPKLAFYYIMREKQTRESFNK